MANQIKLDRRILDSDLGAGRKLCTHNCSINCIFHLYLSASSRVFRDPFWYEFATDHLESCENYRLISVVYRT
jgi:hypothetical protein